MKNIDIVPYYTLSRLPNACSFKLHIGSKKEEIQVIDLTYNEFKDLFLKMEEAIKQDDKKAKEIIELSRNIGKKESYFG